MKNLFVGIVFLSMICLIMQSSIALQNHSGKYLCVNSSHIAKIFITFSSTCNSNIVATAIRNNNMIIYPKNI